MSNEPKLWIRDDAGYESWRLNNPQGYVANVKKDPYTDRILPGLFRIHSARHELESHYNPPNFTHAGYAKVTSNSMVELAVWGRRHGFVLTSDNFCKVPCGSSFFTAEDISDAITPLIAVVHPDEVPDDGGPYLEGATKSVTVNAYERDLEARRACIGAWGCGCYVCGFDFEAEYGVRGKGFIHVHHLDELGLTKKERATDPKNDLRPVCPNCHSMLHRTRPAMDIEVLKAQLATRREE